MCTTSADSIMHINMGCAWSSSLDVWFPVELKPAAATDSSEAAPLKNDKTWIKILPGGTCPKWRRILWVVIKPGILPWREAFRFQLLLTE